MLPLADPNDLRLPPAAQAAMQARPIPLAGTPVAAGAPGAPQNGSRPIPQVAIPARATQDPTGQQPLQSSPIPKATVPGAEQRQTELGRLEKTGSGVSQIRNPILKTLGTIGDVIASGVFPNFGAFIPGTTAHHVMLTNQAGNAVKRDTEQEEAAARTGLQNAQAEEAEAGIPLKGAQAEEARARANELSNPASKPATNELERFFQQNPNATVADWRDYQAAHPEKAVKQAEPHYERADDGSIYALAPDENGKITPQLVIQGNGKKPQLTAEESAFMRAAGGDPADEKTFTPEVMQKYSALKGGQARTPQFTADEAARIRAAGGDPTKPETLTSAILAKAHAIGEKPTPEPGSLELVQDKEGNWVTFNNKTGKIAPTEAVKTSAAVQSRQAQGEVIQKAGDNLIQEIERNRGKLGNLGSYWRQATNGTPISDPDTAALMTSLASFAALQPALHGFRGQQALQGFEGIIGGVPKNPDALIASIKSIQRTAGTVAHPGRESEPAQTHGEAQGGYQVGHKYSGKTYLGGDPNQRGNWQ